MPEHTSTANLADLLAILVVRYEGIQAPNSPPITRKKIFRVHLESVVWPEIVRISLILLVVIAIYV